MPPMLISQLLQVAFRRLLDPSLRQRNSTLAADPSLVLARILLPFLKVLEYVVALPIKLLYVKVFFFVLVRLACTKDSHLPIDDVQDLRSLFFRLLSGNYTILSVLSWLLSLELVLCSVWLAWSWSRASCLLLASWWEARGWPLSCLLNWHRI